MNGLFFFGRIIFGSFFVYSGINHFLSLGMYKQFTAAKGVPLPELAVIVTGLLIVVGGLSLIFGMWPRIGAGCIALFLLGVTPAMHNFWAMTAPGARMMEMGNFMKNFALLGGALMTYGVPLPWSHSLEMRRVVA